MLESQGVTMKNFSIFAAAAAAAMVPATSADAATYVFTITGDYDASFELDSSPTPDDAEDGVYFTIWDVDGFPDALLGLADVTFYNADFDGGLQIDDFYGSTTLLITDGAQLYTGPESAPTFLTGTFGLTEFGGTGTYTLTIADAAGVVPEPATWAMMIGGIGAAGGVLRRRKANVSVRYA